MYSLLFVCTGRCVYVHVSISANIFPEFSNRPSFLYYLDMRFNKEVY